MISSALITFSIMTINFSGRHFPSDIILQVVRYYVSYKLSYREIEEIMAERGVSMLITQPSIGGSSNMLPYWNIRLVEERSLSPLRGGWTRHTLTSKASGNITTKPLISRAVSLIFHCANTVMRKPLAPSSLRQ
jgi:hypothetical protein